MEREQCCSGCTRILCCIQCFLCRVNSVLYPLLLAFTSYMFPNTTDIPLHYIKKCVVADIPYYVDIRNNKQIVRRESGRMRYANDVYLSVPIILPAAIWAMLCYYNLEYVRRLTLLEMPYAPSSPPPPSPPFPPPHFPSPLPPFS